ncbi:aspartic proteinase CDR1-like [Rutidosis leptorrhynchoides]|uniref:aspartic proteinase CDR1-like n=1 Tax=Rutidosis leptorrhynchoides TaxID=125765 RepID=UPI003A98FC82
MTFSSLSLVITLSIIYISGCSPAIPTGGTFTIDLIHRDSVDSPFYDGSMSYSQRMSHTLQRSFINAKRINKNSNNTKSKYQTEIIPDHGEFLLNISFGDPSHKVLAIADSGSDLSWIQCKPCVQCSEHKAPIFDPKKSSTYEPVNCNSGTCKAISTVETKCSKTNKCQFFESYADGSFSNGTVAKESVTLGDKVLQNIIFGCSFSNAGVFRPSWGGIVGLGGGNESLVSQIRSIVPGKFSYCLIPYPKTDEVQNKSSKMTFGDIDFGPNVVSTPLVPKEPKTYYYVTLEAISVGNKRFDVNLGSLRPLQKGNMIVDSGTTLTMLPRNIYEDVEATIRSAINVRTLKDPQKALSLCYRATKVSDVPKFTMHFDGADVELSRENVFVMTSKHIMCLAFRPTSDVAIYGNLAQMDFRVGYDLDNNLVSLEPYDCEKLILEFLADFVVVDLEEDNAIPLVLGRLFLETAGALIVVKARKSTFRDRGKQMSFQTRHIVNPPPTPISSLNVVASVKPTKDMIGNGKPIKCEGRVEKETIVYRIMKRLIGL